MKLVALTAFILAGFGDFVPGTGALVGLVASLMAVWAMPAAVWMSFSAIVYSILATAFPSPGFIFGDLIAERTPLAEGMAEEITAAGAEVAVATNYWLVAIHVALLFYALKRHTDRAVGQPI
jgi:hypothetical protein